MSFVFVTSEPTTFVVFKDSLKQTTTLTEQFKSQGVLGNEIYGKATYDLLKKEYITTKVQFQCCLFTPLF